jgi:hypothetical protein
MINEELNMNSNERFNLLEPLSQIPKIPNSNFDRLNRSTLESLSSINLPDV